MNNHVIEHNIPKQAEGTYYTIPFPVPEGPERVTVAYSYKKLSGKTGAADKLVNVVDLGLMDGAGRFLGWSGGARSEVFVGPCAATKGYKMTELTPGEWKIIVGAYKIPEGGLPVRYEITYTPRGPRWLSGDLHVHSDASDGRHDIHTLANMAQKRGLDFIAAANHNNTAENLHLPVVPGLTFLPAVEWTHYRGHMNFFGAAEPFENSFIANSKEEMLSLIAQAKAKGALVSVNHPKCNFCPYLWEDEDCFDLVEVWNGPMRGANTDAIAWWHGLLLRGKKLPLVGGSDYHKDLHVVRFAHPITRVYAQSPSAEDILAGIAAGHCYVTASVDGIALELRCGDAIMGDSVAFEEGLTLSVSAENMRPGAQLRLITSEGAAAEWTRFPQGKLEARVPVLPAWRFAYLAASQKLFGSELVRAICNPVYFG